MVSPQREMSSPQRSLVLPACLKQTSSISNHSDLPLLQILKMIFSDAFTFLSFFQSTWRSMWAQPRLPHSAPNPGTVLGAQLELSQYQSCMLEALLSQALCTDHLTEFSHQPHNIGAILVPILHTGKLRLQRLFAQSHSHNCTMTASVFSPGAPWTPEPALWWFPSHLLWVSSPCGSLTNLVSLEMKVAAPLSLPFLSAPQGPSFLRFI